MKALCSSGHQRHTMGRKKGRGWREEAKGWVVWEERAQGEAKRWSSQSQQRPSSGARADRLKSSLKIPLKVNGRDPGGPGFPLQLPQP